MQLQDDHFSAGTGLEAIAKAVQETRHTEPRKISTGWRFIILMVRLWATVLFAVGAILVVVAAFEVLSGKPVYRLRVTQSETTLTGWLPAAIVSVLVLLLGKLQSHLAKWIENRKLRRI